MNEPIIGQPAPPFVERPVTLHIATINGRKVAYSSRTMFLVQVRLPHDAYQTMARGQGCPERMFNVMNAYTLGPGWSARLFMESDGGPHKGVIARRKGPPSGRGRACIADGCKGIVPADQGSDYCADCIRADS